MLEAPEALCIAGQIDKDLKGKVVGTVIAGFTPHKFTFFNPAADRFAEMLQGRELTGARSVGGMVEILFGEISVVLSDGANIRFTAAAADLPATHQLLIGFTDESCITVMVRMYAGILCFGSGGPQGQLSDYYAVAAGKPQMLSDNFTREYFISVASQPSLKNRSAKALLATEQRFPGLGNGVLQDILFNAGIHPKRKTSTLGESGLDTLYRSIRHTLGEMAGHGGRDSEMDLYGNKGGYVAFLSKDTAGKPCPKCGSTIVKENYMGGSVYFCPACQPIEP
ncbi:MAG: endonuclease VIII [Alistipes sp.]|nr:endonuclease VIII [Alistipes sp.]